jgi:tetratricopeptide (TPR) repeat protein
MVLTFSHSRPPRQSVLPEPDANEPVRLARAAALHAGRGEISQAMRCYQLALLMDESRADLWVNYGILQGRVGQLNDALESFDFALRIDPANYMARYRIGRVCYELGRPLEAVANFRTVTNARPAYAPAWRYLVQLTWALGDHEEADAIAREGLKHAVGDTELQSLRERIAKDRAEADTEM